MKDAAIERNEPNFIPANLTKQSWLVAFLMLAMSLAVLLPFRNDISTVFRFWDGPLYIYVAKTFYNIPIDHPFQEYNLPPVYFASHLPLFPILIRVTSLLTFGDLLIAGLVLSLLCSVLSSVLFLHLLTKGKLVTFPFWTAILFCFFPPRWLMFHSVVASEPLFLCLILAAFLAYETDHPFLVMIFVLLASVTRITGTLLIPVFALIYIWKKRYSSAFLILVSAAGILATFTLYAYRFGDFWAYFHWNAGQHKIIDPHPFAIFRLYAKNINFHSTELYFYTYVLYAAGTLLLWKRKDLFIYGAVFFVFHTFVYHVDLSRYILMLAPFSLLIGFDPVLRLKYVRWVTPLMLYLSYVYTWGWIPLNLCSTASYQKLVHLLSQ